jgi:hypothetical protein
MHDWNSGNWNGENDNIIIWSFGVYVISYLPSTLHLWILYRSEVPCYVASLGGSRHDRRAIAWTLWRLDWFYFSLTNFRSHCAFGKLTMNAVALVLQSNSLSVTSRRHQSHLSYFIQAQYCPVFWSSSLKAIMYYLEVKQVGDYRRDVRIGTAGVPMAVGIFTGSCRRDQRTLYAFV